MSALGVSVSLSLIQGTYIRLVIFFNVLFLKQISSENVYGSMTDSVEESLLKVAVLEPCPLVPLAPPNSLWPKGVGECF